MPDVSRAIDAIAIAKCRRQSLHEDVPVIARPIAAWIERDLFDRRIVFDRAEDEDDARAVAAQ